MDMLSYDILLFINNIYMKLMNQYCKLINSTILYDIISFEQYKYYTHNMHVYIFIYIYMCVIEQRFTRSKMCANKNVHELKLKDIGNIRAGQYLNTLYLNTAFKYIYCI